MSDVEYPLDAHALSHLLAGRRVGRKVQVFASVRSTNDVAWEELRAGGPSGTVVVADAQTAGRGRFGRSWYSPPGLGLWMSVALVPDLPIERAPHLVPLGALAVCDGIEALARDQTALRGLAATIRWPNDVMVGVRKVCGVLVEARDLQPQQPGLRRGYVLGLGINVNQTAPDFPAEIADHAVSLRMLAGEPIDRNALAGQVLLALDDWLGKLVGGDHAAVAASWRRRSALIGQRVLLRAGGESYAGRAMDLDPCDGIVVQLDTGVPRWFRTEHVEKLEVLES